MESRPVDILLIDDDPVDVRLTTDPDLASIPIEVVRLPSDRPGS